MLKRTAIALFCGSLGVSLLACSGSSTSDAGGGSSGSTNGAGTNSGGAQGGNSSNGGGAKSGGSSSTGASAGGPSSGGAAAGGAPAWQEDWRQCSVDEDCTVIPIETCCGCVSTGVSEAHADEARASNAGFNSGACPPLGCATQGCAPDSMAACEMGVCVPKPGCSARDEQSCESDDKCQKYQARLCTASGDFAYFTCGKPKGACDEALTCVLSPNAQPVLFPNSCVPDGFSQACPKTCQ